jgi:hypothetical protein
MFTIWHVNEPKAAIGQKERTWYNGKNTGFGVKRCVFELETVVQIYNPSYSGG